jgi:hypothetical protein
MLLWDRSTQQRPSSASKSAGEENLRHRASGVIRFLTDKIRLSGYVRRKFKVFREPQWNRCVQKAGQSCPLFLTSMLWQQRTFGLMNQ